MLVCVCVCVLQNSGSQGNEEELRDRISIRSNVTAALASLNISSVKEVAQLSAALQQCVVGPGSCLFSPDCHSRGGRQAPCFEESPFSSASLSSLSASVFPCTRLKMCPFGWV